MIQEILNAHNRYRAEVSIPPMRWSDDLAKKGQVGANHLIANRLWQHKGAGGENLWVGSSHRLALHRWLRLGARKRTILVRGQSGNVRGQVVFR